MRAVLVTGGTGSFGKRFVCTILGTDVERVVVYSRDELKQYEMAAEIPDERVRYFIGDVRDSDRLARAMCGIDTVVHAAAMKQVPACEYNPFEAVKTNVHGAQNVIECAMDKGVNQVVALSTDKAAAPINLYGATKLASDKLFIAANNYRGKRDCAFSVVRYGNVMMSRGSVIPLFLKQREQGELTITDPRMTRFNLTLQQGVDFVLAAFRRMVGGELFVPKLPSYRITDVAEAIAPGVPVSIIGMRPGEKLHEDLITEMDALRAFDMGDYYVLTADEEGNLPEGFRYSSDTNSEWLSVEDIRRIIAAVD